MLDFIIVTGLGFIMFTVILIVEGIINLQNEIKKEKDKE